MVVCGIRVLSVATDEKLSQAAANQSTRRVTVANVRGTVYDCNGFPLTNAENETVTVIFPTEQGVISLAKMLDGDELKAAEETLKQGAPVTVKGACPDSSEGTVELKVPVRYSGMLSHVLGYTDGSGHGVTGIEKGFDDILYSGEPVSVSYSIDSAGHMLKGAGYSINPGSASNSVTLTVDKRIQSITEQAMSQVPSGAAVVIEAATGKIRAMVSRPDYVQTDIAEYLDSEDSPLINRALYAYNIGSVFKPCLAAAAIESGVGNYLYNCMGSIYSNGLTFKCHKLAGHGELDLKGAIAYSCNTYFYTLGTRLGAESVYNAARLFRFGDSLDLGGGIISAAGNMPSLQQLQSSEATLINLSIGQGDLLLSPVALSCMYSAIVNNGEYILPSIVEGITVDGVYTEYERCLPTRAMSAGTAEILEDYLKNALANGTGSVAYTEGITAGGKTGTAQTGWKEGDRSILNGWFCGFMVGKEQTYVIVILKEDVKSGSADCAPVFKEITGKMTEAGY